MSTLPKFKVVLFILLIMPLFAPGPEARGGEVLLIPDSQADVVAMFDPFDGHYLGNFIDGKGIFKLPVNAIQGPGGNIFVSDQNADSIFVFDTAGTYLGVYADDSDGLKHIHGIDFFKGYLFVTSSDGYVALFQGPHNRLPDFIADGSEPYDILFFPDGRSLVSDIAGNTDNVRLYRSDGSFIRELFKIDFPEQLQYDTNLPGYFLSSSFSARQVSDFDINGNIFQTTPLGDYGRGAYRLGNGNLLVAGYDGVRELDPGTGMVITQIMHGNHWRYIEKISLTETLFTDVSSLSAATGGVINFTLNAGLAQGHRKYFILGSITGTQPGLPLPGGLVILPLNWDAFTDLVVAFANTAALPNFHGTLTGSGAGAAQLNTHGPLPPSSVGGTTHFAYLLYDQGIYYPYDFVSNPVAITVTP